MTHLNDLTSATTSLGGVPVAFHGSGAMWVPGASLLVLSDLHFEKGSSYARKGQLIPPYDTRATLKVVATLCKTFRPKIVLSLGDAFHDREAESRMQADDAAMLEGLCGAADWIWVLGNHDPVPPKRFQGTAYEAVEVGGLHFVHEPGDHPDWQVAGHLHPCAVATREGEGRRVRRPCFATDGARLVMPAFGAFTGGLNVLDPAFDPVFARAPDVYLLGSRRVFRVPASSLRADGVSKANALRLTASVRRAVR